MKKLILSAAIVLGSLTSFANKTIPTTTEIVKIVQEEYTEITADQLPEAVQTALKTSYPDAIIDKAYVNEKKEYKIEISLGDQKAAIFADANGNWIKK
ncbi:PepSY-like domain-containing protein [Flavobacterium sp. SM2513]|uniref:PepSY-like domain-containing protein n=1 Tax=Flavobacterium sp. SM2513 TaxID=3424766 RepID=UPI003D7FD0DF